MEAFKRGDRVTLTEPLGILTTDDMGIVVEVYAVDQAPDDVDGTKDYDQFRGLFDYGVAFPKLRLTLHPEQAGWVTDEIDLSQFHAGDIIPVRHDELHLSDDSLRGVAGE